MLGRFLEVALHAADSGASFDYYRRLGFGPAVAGDVWPHAYGVVTCEGLALGLHGRATDRLSLVFVRPNVGELHRELIARVGVCGELAVSGSDAFNRLELREATGSRFACWRHAAFRPPLPSRETLLGRFSRVSLPARDRPRRRFLGAAGHGPRTATGLSLAGRHPRTCCCPASGSREGRGPLEARGFEPEERPLPEGEGGLLQLRSPEDQLLQVLA